jgi:hypothetical protein
MPPSTQLSSVCARTIPARAAHGRVIVLGSEQAIEAANSERPGLLSVSRVM